MVQMSDGPVPLTADQREEIRRMLTSFGGVMEEETAIVPVQPTEEVQEFKLRKVDDLFARADDGTTVELAQLTSGSFRYHIVRIGVSLFKPYVLDRIPVDVPFLIRLCKEEMGVIMHHPTAGLLTGSVEQSEPITMFQIELEEPTYDIIKTIRWST